MNEVQQLEVNPRALRTHVLQLLDEVESGRGGAAARLAAAEAQLRIVYLGDGRDKELRLLERARDLDPYKSEVYLLLGVYLMRAGRANEAVRALDYAAFLAPQDPNILRERAHASLCVAKELGSTDRADTAFADYEAALRHTPDDDWLQLASAEALMYCKTKQVRSSLALVLARIIPREPHVPAMTRLLYQAIFTFGVGQAKKVDEQNRSSMKVVREIAARWAEQTRQPAFEGVIAAAAAKCESAEELCANIAQHAKKISDVRVLRLLLRERLADVKDPEERIVHFRRAMEAIPPFDGIAQDFLQLLHLSAKRAAAEGHLDRATSHWQAVLEQDPNNLGAVANLARVARHGDASEELERRERELQTLYGQYSPRADLVLARAGARFKAQLREYLAALADPAEPRKPDCHGALSAIGLFVRAHALLRLANEPSLREKSLASAQWSRILDVTAREEGLIEWSMEVLKAPTERSLPIAYAYLDLPKDAPSEDLIKTLEEHEQRWTHRLEEAAHSSHHERIGAFLERLRTAVAPLVDPLARAAYDAGTCETSLAEFHREYFTAYLRLVDAFDNLEGTAKDRLAVASNLWNLKTQTVSTYLETTMRDEEALTRNLGMIAYSGVFDEALAKYRKGKPEAAVDAIRRCAPGADPLVEYHRLSALFIGEDDRLSLDEAMRQADDHLRRALTLARQDEMRDAIQSILSRPPEQRRSALACERAMNMSGSDPERALRVLWSVHFQRRRYAPKDTTPAALAWAQTEPCGEARFAYCVASALRATTIEWYNSQRPNFEFQATECKVAALRATEVAEGWARYSVEALEGDGDMSTENRDGLTEALFKLRERLYSDRSSLSH